MTVKLNALRDEMRTYVPEPYLSGLRYGLASSVSWFFSMLLSPVRALAGKSVPPLQLLDPRLRCSLFSS
jgi:hypothetical protein